MVIQEPDNNQNIALLLLFASSANTAERQLFSESGIDLREWRRNMESMMKVIFSSVESYIVILS